MSSNDPTVQIKMWQRKVTIISLNGAENKVEQLQLPLTLLLQPHTVRAQRKITLMSTSCVSSRSFVVLFFPLGPFSQSIRWTFSLLLFLLFSTLGWLSDFINMLAFAV